MSEDLSNTTTEETKTETKVVELSPTQQKAVEQGWKPKEEWEAEGKDPSDWRDAKEYVERGELFDLIESQKKELKQVRKTLDTLKNHHLKVRETAYDEALKHLKEQLNAAKSEENITAILDITEQISDLKEKKVAEITTSKAELETPANETAEDMEKKFDNWKKKNSWYKPDSADKVSAYAEKVGSLFRRQDPNASFDDFLAHVEREVKREFADVFKPPKKGSNVEGSGETRPNSKEESYPLTEAEQKIMNDLVRSKTMTKEQYIKDLKDYDKAKGIAR